MRLIPSALVLIIALAIHPAMAEDATIIIDGGKIAIAQPALQSWPVHTWLGDRNGGQGEVSWRSESAQFDRDDLETNPFLAYTKEAEFLRLSNVSVDDARLRFVVENALPNTSRPIEIVTFASVDFDGDGISETLVQAHTARSVTDPYAATKDDFDALLILTFNNDTITVRDLIVRTIDPDTDGGARSILNPVALGRSGDRPWDLLVEETSRHAGAPLMTFEVTINGQTSQPSAEETRVTTRSLLLYRYWNGRLVPSDTISTTTTSFCRLSDCAD